MGFFFNFRWFYLKKSNHVCLKENAVPICPDTELSWCRNVLVSNCLGAELLRKRSELTRGLPIALQGSENGRVITIDNCMSQSMDIDFRRKHITLLLIWSALSWSNSCLQHLLSIIIISVWIFLPLVYTGSSIFMQKRFNFISWFL